MRYILIDLSSDNYLQQPNLFGGYEGEHNETILQVKLPKRMIDIECSGYRFDFQTSEDNKISSPLIPISELNNDILSFHLTQQLTIAGKLLFNVIAILSDENTVSMISKTNTVTLRIEDAVDGNMQLIDPNGYKDELQKMVDERIMEINPAKVDQTYSHDSENAQSGKAVAGAISNLVSLEDNTEWIFDGGDASGSVEIDLVIDAEMSDTSNNPVSNKVIKKYVDNMVDLIYPVGSIYMSANDTSPSILFGGEWERIKDRFLLAAGNKYSVGSTGGEAEHKLTVDEMPSHNHGSKSLVGYMWNIASQSDTHNLAANGIVSTAMVETHGYAMHSTLEVVDGFKIDATHTHNSVGGGKSHNNMPPYLAVYMWQRIS